MVLSKLFPRTGIEILDAVLSALRGATRAEAAVGGGADLVILPLPHTQLVLLLWHSLSAVARGSFIAKTTAAVCEVVDAGEARSGAPWCWVVSACHLGTSSSASMA